MNDLAKNLLLWVVVAAVLMVVFQSFSPDRAAGAAAPSYSQFLDQVDDGNVQKVVFGNESRSGILQIEYTLKNGDKVAVSMEVTGDEGPIITVVTKQ